jgi:tetratricopeptide (TPR) repeat protein
MTLLLCPMVSRTAALQPHDGSPVAPHNVSAATGHADRAVHTWIAIGREDEAIGRHADAIRAYDQALAMNPNQCDVVCLRATAYQHSGLSRQAAADYQYAIRLSPTCASAWGGLAAVHFMQGRCSESTSMYRHALEFAPNDSGLYDGLAAIYRATDPRHAVSCFTAALRCNRHDAAAYHGRGEARLALGDVRHGTADLTRAVELSPDPTYRADLYRARHRDVAAASLPESLASGH